MSIALPAVAAAVFTVNFSLRPPLTPCGKQSSPFKTHHSSFLSAFTRPTSQTTTQASPPFRRKLLCPPVAGKHVREDYLVKKLSAEEIQELVKGDRTVPLIIDFYSTWCGPCILMAQELEMLAVEFEKNALIVKVDTDDEYEFARDMQVRGLPTLYVFSPDPNKDAIRAEGLIPIQMIRDIVESQR
ncbi:thioredoxin-like protein CITRX, chloroplastic [Impatiens glandulifera]|uniref:thioredoxin-like protein CITRX, chloroplastic n=1 Tax=Impatiens glandulifera TaxID=253017 RepID=UPI001FB0B2CC|nr:thioredoxin-like protein CITRX, chloroplastic [Impatiens glandulifera]